MTATYQTIGAILLTLTAASAGAAIWRGREFLQVAAKQRTTPKTRPSVWLRIFGIILFMNGMMLFHFFPPAAFFLGIIAFTFCVSISRAHWPKDRRTGAYIVVSLVGLAWMTYGAYELYLSDWKATVAGAPIRIDLLFLAPLFYVASGKAYAILELCTKAAR